MFSGLLSGAKERAVRLNGSSAPKGGENVKFTLSQILGPIFDSNINCCCLSLSTLCQNKEITRSMGPCLFCRGPFDASEGPSQDQEGAIKARKGLFENKVGKQRLEFIYEHSTRGPSMAHFIPIARAPAEPLPNQVWFKLKSLPTASENPVRTSSVGLCRSVRDLFRIAKL